MLQGRPSGGGGLKKQISTGNKVTEWRGGGETQAEGGLAIGGLGARILSPAKLQEEGS